VTVLPYFLSAGVHITRDIPGEINKASENHPNLKIKIANYFGSRNEIAEILMKTALDIK
jgi:sirohydrochlorin ferrochelatase